MLALGLNEDAFVFGQPALSREDFLVGGDIDAASALRDGIARPSQLAGLPMRMAVATVFGWIDDLVIENRSRSGSLENRPCVANAWSVSLQKTRDSPSSTR